ncbi:glycosyltransferase [Planococcus sp. YIM B11945]|uniref:glycosyltransferase n=1 Tax=Planococcus sp. YIM B11945 TaxID=3435410 RepID=UPI003D7EF8A7
MKFTLVSTNYQPNYYRNYEIFREKSLVDDKVDFLNVYDFFSGRDYNYKDTLYHPVDIEGYMCVEIDKDQNYRYFKDGYYERYRSYNPKTGKLKFEDVMDVYTRKRKERLEYNNFGVCHKKIVYKRNTTNKLEEFFYDDKGQVYCIFSYNGTDENKLVRVYLNHNNKMLMFATEKDFFQYAFDQILQPGGVTFCDARLLDKPLLNCTVNTKKLFVLHNSHNIDGTITKSYKYLIDNADKASKIIVLTQEQLTDLLELGISSEKLTVIPHSMEEKPLLAKPRNPEKKFVFIGRLAAQKQVHHIVQAFSQVAKQYPDYKLEIYGDGEDFASIAKLIDDLEARNSIKMMGKTDDIPGVFRNAIASLISSHYEGFGLVIMESLHYGCPVISYDFKYGPKDLLTPGENGYIIEKDNVDMLAETIIKMIHNPIKDVTLSSDYYLSNTIEKWGQLLKQF